MERMSFSKREIYRFKIRQNAITAFNCRFPKYQYKIIAHLYRYVVG